MNVSHSRSIAFLAAALAISVALYLGRLLISESPPDQHSPKRFERVIVIKTSDACQCALERCSEVEETVRMIVVQLNRGVELEIIDYAENPGRANEIMQRFDASLIPVVLVVDGKGKAVYRSEWDLDERLLATTIESLTPEEK
jgi:hypothetical protein